VLSGAGLLNIYSWLKDSGRYREPAWLRDAVRKSDPAKIISETALAKRQPLCRKALKIFVSILGSTAGNLALTGMTTGGIYLGGGIPPRILPYLQEGIFIEAFINKGRFEDWMRKVPVKVILNDQAALIGAADCALEMSPHLA
jgi:glucokinase